MSQVSGCVYCCLAHIDFERIGSFALNNFGENSAETDNVACDRGAVAYLCRAVFNTDGIVKVVSLW